MITIKPGKTREYQFTTSDDKDIYAGDHYWGVFDDGRIVRAKADPMRYWDKKANRFSTKKAAIDFVKSRGQEPKVIIYGKLNKQP